MVLQLYLDISLLLQAKVTRDETKIIKDRNVYAREAQYITGKICEQTQDFFRQFLDIYCVV